MTARLFLILCFFGLPFSAAAAQLDSEPRTAVMSAFEPELHLLLEDLEGAETHRLNGVDFVTGRLEGQDVVLFLSGISMVNAAMTTQLALDHFNIDSIVFSGIAGGVDPTLNVGDVVVSDAWGQYLEMIIGRETDDGLVAVEWMLPTEFPNYGTMVTRHTQVTSDRSDAPETMFWFDVDPGMVDLAKAVARSIELEACDADGACLAETPKMVVGGNGVSGSAFVDNADFRTHVFDTFDARVLDMESAAVAHVAYVNQVPFIAFRSLSDLAGGEDEDNQMPVFMSLAARNAAVVVRGFLAATASNH